MKHYLLLALAALTFLTLAHAGDNGLITKKSAHPPKETIDRLETLLTKKGITVALRWSHSDRASGVGIDVRPTELIIFGNPRLGSHMFTSNQTAGIDFPMKVLAWEDADGQTWVTYNDPSYLAERHGIDDRTEIVQKMSGALQKLTDAAAAP
jgi:YD repeat-containing protein